MQQSVLEPTAFVRPPSRIRQLTFVGLGLCLAALLAGLATVLVQLNMPGMGAPFLPTANEGHIAEGTVVTLADADVPAIAQLEPALLDALRRAEADAVAAGAPGFQITSGWRSEGYQRWLFEDAVEHYASEEIARQFVATPQTSSHVTGDAVDIVPLDAQLWLIEQGAQYGLCQIYANERWHFELATSPGGTCPEMKADAAG
jgi:zinc D-Ala-D-Ala carboxypeptidase